MLTKTLPYLQKSYLDRFVYHGDRFVYAGYLGALGYAIFYWQNLAYDPNLYESPSLRVVTVILWLLMAIKKYWPQRLLKLYPAYVYFTLFFNLSFFTSFMLFANEAHILWTTSHMMTLLFLTSMLSWIHVTLIFCLGLISGLIFYYITFPIFTLSSNFLVVLPLYVTAIIVFASFDLTSKLIGLEQVYKEKASALKAAGSTIAHEMRTPLSSITLHMNILRQNWNTLWERYDYVNNRHENKEIAEIPENKQQVIRKTPDDVVNIVANAQTTINLLLETTRYDSIKKDDFKEHSIQSCIHYALETYPFDNINDAKRIKFLDKNDFYFWGSKTLLTYVLYNLIKNSLYFIEKDRNIEIWLEQAENQNLLYFKDYGIGIPDEVLPNIFNEFFSTKSDTTGNGLGLAFCKRVIESFGGNIICSTKKNHHTTFVLSFPKKL